MKQIKSFVEHLADNKSQSKMSESLVGKGAAFAQNRQHQNLKAQLVSKLNLIQNDCRQASQEEDPNKRNRLLFEVIFEFANSLKLFAEMSSKTNSIAAIGVLDAESIKKEFELALSKKSKG